MRRNLSLLKSSKKNNYKKSIPLTIGIIFLTLAACNKSTNKATTEPQVFSYSIPYAPQTFDPILQQGINSKHLLNHLYLTLLKWDKHGNLTPAGADRCEWVKTNLVCHLKKNISFQDGSPIYSQHYLNSINLLKKENLKETLNFNDITVFTKDKHTLVFKSNTKQLSLKHKLTLIEISARKEEKYYKSAKSVISSANYVVYEYKKNQSITLEKRTSRSDSYKNKINANDDRLKVKIYFIEDQGTALRMYKSKKLNALIQLPIREIEPYINSTELYYVPMVRMDGVYFNKSLDPNFKKALFHSLNYSELQYLYKSKGTPGCPTLPRDFYSLDLCYKFDLDLAKLYLKKTSSIPNKVKLTYSTLGGDDIQRGMEWMSNQWGKHLNLKVDLDPSESGIFFQKVRDRNFSIIRKGNPLDAPTCIEALFTFSSKNPNNLSLFKDRQFDLILDKMEAFEPNSIYDLQKLCDQGLKKLYEDYVFLPLGPIYFSYLDDGQYKGWFINMLNTLDLEQLEFKTENL